ncbi:uncharacterized protein LOC133784388 [Humulus lupulus]|uniref:uncharacterized protein LOC133784388 n=1 Tax=Humulus lupulus TaxID=3486 RepID=UPI002B400970|nr:uncharacterized protein LOC133784388 [Humulus lupulus]
MMKIKYLVWLLFMIICVAASSCRSDNHQNKRLKYENGVMSSELPSRESNHQIKHGKKLGLEEGENNGHELTSIRKAKAVYGGSNDLMRRPKSSQSAPTPLLSSPKQRLLGLLVCVIMFCPF